MVFLLPTLSSDVKTILYIPGKGFVNLIIDFQFNAPFPENSEGFGLTVGKRILRFLTPFCPSDVRPSKIISVSGLISNSQLYSSLGFSMNLAKIQR